MITTFYPPHNFGGDGIFVRHLSHELARRGHQVEVVHCVDSYRLLARGLPDNSSENISNVTVHGLKSPWGFLSPLASHQTGFPIFKSKQLQAILEKGFDVVHFHNISLFGPEVLKYGRGIKLYTIHDYWLVCATHALFRFNREPCRERRCFACTLSFKRPPQWWRYTGMLESATRHVDAFIAPSQISLYKHRQLGFDAPAIHLPNFIPDDNFEDISTYDQLLDREHVPYFLFVGRLEKLKGLQTLLPVFRRYQKAELRIAGTGSYESQLRELAAGCANIHFLGHVSGEELLAIYRKAVAVIFPLLNFQGFLHLPRGAGAPMVMIEAFSQRTPVIVKRLGTLPGFVEETGSGLIYDSDDTLIVSMDRLLGDKALRNELGLNGYKTYRKEWTAEAHLARYFELIEEIAARKRSSGQSSSSTC